MLLQEMIIAGVIDIRTRLLSWYYNWYFNYKINI